MFRIILLRGASSVSVGSQVTNKCLTFSGLCQPSSWMGPSRALSQPSKHGGPRLPPDSNESLPPLPPPLTEEEIDFMKDIAKNGIRDFPLDIDTGGGDKSKLPEPPKGMLEWGTEVGEVAEEDYDVDVEVPFLPPSSKDPSIKSFMIPEGQTSEGSILSLLSKSVNENEKNIMLVELEELKKVLGDNMLENVIAAWARAADSSPANRPMPLHELANKSLKVKELVKLGVDFSVIADRHGDLERLMHLDWETQIKPHIRFLVDIGIDPDRLGIFFTKNTALLWTTKDDMQVRINYLEAKQFSPDVIRHIVNKAPFWLTTPTKEIDSRLGFLQRTFCLTGNEVRSVASAFPTLVSNRKWNIFVDTTKLMDREFGFEEWERKQLLLHEPFCYMRPNTVRKAFDLCHNQIGLSHTQLVRHASLLVNRVSKLKPRYDFLKFLRRDIFDVTHPLYVSPDWLWKGTTEEFCQLAAKTTVEEYENFLRHSTVL